VAADRAHPLVLEVDLGGGVQDLLQATGTDQGCRAIEPVDGLDLFGDVNVPLLADFLLDQLHREEGGQVSRADGLTSPGMEDWWRGYGQVGHDVVPAGRQLTLA